MKKNSLYRMLISSGRTIHLAATDLDLGMCGADQLALRQVTICKACLAELATRRALPCIDSEVQPL